MPTCPTHPGIDLEPKKKGWFCDDCGEIVLTYEQVPRPDVMPLEAKLDGIDLSALPSILALPFHDYLTERRSVLKLWAMCDAVELSLRFIVFGGVADITRDAEKLPDALRAALSQGIERPTLGAWRAMAKAVCGALPAKTVVPEFPRFLGSLDSVLDAPPGQQRTPETALADLRNRLAHGGGMTEAAARGTLDVFEPRFAAAMECASWLRDVNLVSVRPDAPPGLLRGPGSRPVAYHGTVSGLPRDASVVLVRGTDTLVLWPLVLYGRPARLDPDAPAAASEALQVYVRRDEVSLMFTPLGSDDVLQSVAGQSALDQFLAVFAADKAPEAQFEVKGFEAELRKDSSLLVGREADIATVQAAVDETNSGVLWIHGTAGIGKSYLMARFAADLVASASSGTLILPFRFRVGDARCARAAFLRFACERLHSWLGEDAGVEVEGTRDELAKLLGKVTGDRRVVFVLDGIDEIGLSDAAFARNIPLSLGKKHVTWVCAGRPDAGLTGQFGAAGAKVLFPDGLEPMSRNDIRTMLLADMDRSRKRLLELDGELDGEVRNAFVDKVAERSEGVPLYVRYVLADLKSGKRVAEEDPKWLPRSLAAYYEDMLARLSIGSLHKVLTPLACTLAVAKEALDVPVLQALLVPDHVVKDDESGAEIIRAALAAIQSMVRRGPTMEGGTGFTLYHQSLRDHMEQSPATKDAVDLARASIADTAKHWEAVREGSPANYLYRHGVTHLLESGEQEAVRNVLTSFDYLMARLKGLPSLEVSGLVGDFQAVTRLLPERGGTDFRLWAAFFGERAHILRRGNEEWPAHKILLQLAVEHADDSPVTLAAEGWLDSGRCDWLWLRNPRRVARSDVRPCLAVLEGHNARVTGATQLANGRILSWSVDNTLRLWDGDGSPVAVLEGHTHRVNAARQLQGGHILSWSWDNTLRLWNSIGLLIAVLQGHTHRVAAATQFPDGRILSCSKDKTMRIWSHDGLPISALEGHNGAVTAAMRLSDGRILSWSEDNTLRLWDETGIPTAVLEGHTRPVNGAAELLHGSILSWASETSIRIWSSTGRPIRTLDGHSDWVEGAAQLRDGRILSWSEDKTLRLWDKDGSPIKVLGGHTHRVDGATQFPDGRVLSWSSDGILRLWDEDGNSVGVLEGHNASVAARLISDSRILSWSLDRTVRLWDEGGDTMSVFDGHTAGVEGATELADGRLLSWSEDNTLRLWDTVSRRTIALEGHNDRVEGAARLTDGRVVSWSRDKTVRLWGRDGFPMGFLALEGYGGGPIDVIDIPDGRIVCRYGCDVPRRYPENDDLPPPPTAGCVTSVFDRDGHPILKDWNAESAPSRSETWTPAQFGRPLAANALAVGVRGAYWHGDSKGDVVNLSGDGTLVVSLESGHVFCLKLYHGDKRISLAELPLPTEQREEPSLREPGGTQALRFR